MTDLEQKADWSSVYTQPTPAEYLLHVRQSEYNAPDFACHFLRPLIKQMTSALGRPLSIMDLGASYAILTTMLRYDLTLDELINIFVEGETLRSLEWTDIEQSYQALHHRLVDQSRHYLTDVSKPAMDFAKRLHLCDQAFCLDMDRNGPSIALLERIPDVDLYVAVGSLAYIGNTFFEKALSIITKRSLSPTFVFVVYRIFFPGKLEELFKVHGYTLRRIGEPFKRGRRFASDTEQGWVIDTMKAQGIDTMGFEDNGYYGCEILLAEHQEKLPFHQQQK